MTYIIVLIFVGMCLQGLFTFFQVKNYQKAMGSLKGKGLLGVGFRRGVLRGGQILILSYDRKTEKINNCEVMRGLTSFERFKTAEDYIGLSLSEVKKLALLEDQKINRQWINKINRPKKVTPQKRGALLQAVNAIETHMKKEERQKIHEKRRLQRAIVSTESD